MNGILNVYKEKGYTSHDVVAKLRGILKQKKIGHTGTLDPDAEGVLPVCLGKATKLCDLLTDKDKVYEAVLLLGIQTDTQDITGNILNQIDISAMELALTQEKVREAILSFLGEYDQIPPMYSALKVGGKKLCDLARQGITIQREARRIHIYSIEIHSIQLPRVEFSVECSKGTYIRTLCNDIGEKLGCYGCMESLVRTKAGSFQLKDSLRLADVEALAGCSELDSFIIPIDKMFEQYSDAVISNSYLNMLLNGNVLKEEYFNSISKEGSQTVRVYDETGDFHALYAFDDAMQLYKCVKMF
ncbi:tRNA pseudouridine(55) synthase TruB [Parasporobacterium paucivorans]|uniref:tRNA pseudouridine synthase B n=1 Tax=Parasporobacterium paucivorans DSM 15970 TaxID=1122934 RepID=A0A1M6ETY8_9FIRM|nr:tRNA pseudouridine(55) synthase TruB [Parasporobacterium paucivorans]SHI88971.1 tRNA pseudouridine synthase B [Parasporobacterium paucivorans DSM 15970]